MEHAVKFQIRTDDDLDSKEKDERRNSDGVLVEELAEDGSDMRKRNGGYSAVSSVENGVAGGAAAANSADLDRYLDNDFEPDLERDAEVKRFRPTLHTEVSKVSCTDSTKGLLE